MRIPATEAVVITALPGSGLSQDAALRMAKAVAPLSVLAEAGIQIADVRRAFTGGFLVEIAGKRASEKADWLAARLATAFEKGKERA